MKFEPVPLSEMPTHRQGRRGRVSYPILKTYLETGLPVAKMDRTGIQQSLMGLTSCLNAYVKSHSLPVKIFQRNGDLYLARTDVETDEEGNVIGIIETDIDKLEMKGKTEGQSFTVPTNATPINADEVQKRFDLEVGQVTK